jgi:hypothetical protein
MSANLLCAENEVNVEGCIGFCHGDVFCRPCGTGNSLRGGAGDESPAYCLVVPAGLRKLGFATTSCFSFKGIIDDANRDSPSLQPPLFPSASSEIGGPGIVKANRDSPSLQPPLIPSASSARRPADLLSSHPPPRRLAAPEAGKLFPGAPQSRQGILLRRRPAAAGPAASFERNKCPSHLIGGSLESRLQEIERGLRSWPIFQYPC